MPTRAAKPRKGRRPTLRPIASGDVAPTFRRELKAFREGLPALRDGLTRSIGRGVPEGAMNELAELTISFMAGQDGDVCQALSARDVLAEAKAWLATYKAQLALLNGSTPAMRAVMSQVRDFAGSPHFTDPIEDADDVTRKVVAFRRLVNALEGNEADQPVTHEAFQGFLAGVDRWAARHDVDVRVSKALPAEDQEGFEPVLLIVDAIPERLKPHLSSDRIKDLFCKARAEVESRLKPRVA